jgi:hypothetical protein
VVIGGGVVVVQEKVLHTLTQVKLQPLRQVPRFVAEDGADRQVVSPRRGSGVRPVAARRRAAGAGTLLPKSAGGRRAPHIAQHKGCSKPPCEGRKPRHFPVRAGVHRGERGVPTVRSEVL